jgi:hypothetical protein
MQIWTPSAYPRDNGDFDVSLNPGSKSGKPFAIINLSEDGASALVMHTAAECDKLIKAAALAKSMLLGETSEPVPQPAGEPHRALRGERECLAESEPVPPRAPGTYVCTAQAGHGGEHVSFNPGGGEFYRWPQVDGGSEDLDAALVPDAPYNMPVLWTGGPFEPDADNRCDAPREGFNCTLRRDHVGDHVAHGSHPMRALDAWPQDAPAGTSMTPLCDAKAPTRNGGEWKCTLRAGHEGPHEAHGAHPLPVWVGGGVLRYEQEYEVGKR